MNLHTVLPSLSKATLLRCKAYSGPDRYSILAHLGAAASAGFAASLLRVPAEVVKQRMQTGAFLCLLGF
jgi:hypothetical protein